MTWRRLALGLLLVFPSASMAQDVTLHGMADFRLVAPSGQVSNVDGGLGKFSWGDGRGSPVLPEFGQGVLRGSVLFTPALRAVAEIRYDPQQKTAIDLLDAYFRYSPVSTSRWRWGIRAGAFFPPISLETPNIGWTPEWTLTPSALNAWIGEELRIIGTEMNVEWRGDLDRFELVAAAYGLNQPAGEAMSAYGWTFDARPTGLADHLRLPGLPVAPGAKYNYEFRQFDQSIGWYTGIAWERLDLGRIALLRYDNEANPHKHDSAEFAWHTRFWSLAGNTQIGPVVVLAQAMVGTTVIEPLLGSNFTTEFWAWYVLAGIERGNWRYAVRFDQFATSESGPATGLKGTEHGVAGTAAIIWTPRKGINVIGEVISTNYNRAQRVLIGQAPHVIETQAQLALRVSF